MNNKASSCFLFEKKADGSKDLACYFDYANDFSLNISAEEIFAKAKGQDLIGFTGAIEGTVEFSAEVFTEELFKTKLGTDIVKANKEVVKREVLEVVGGEITLAGIPVAGTTTVFALHKGSNVEHSEKLTYTVKEEETAPETRRTKTGAPVVLTIEGAVDGDMVAVYYLEKATDVKSLKLGAGSKKTYEIRAKVLGRDTLGQDVFMELVLENCQAELNIELSLAADAPSSVSTTFRLIANENQEFGDILFL